MGKGRGWHGESQRHSRAALKGKESGAFPESHVALGRVEIKHPEVQVDLIGEDGNAFAILGRVNKAMTRAGVKKSERDAFLSEAMSDDYNHLLATVMRWVTTD